MNKSADFPCPNCGKLNFVTFAQVKKNKKANVPIAFPCGCSLPLQEVIDKLAEIVTRELGKRNPKFPK
jgi:hypothetical protein